MFMIVESQRRFHEEHKQRRARLFAARKIEPEPRLEPKPEPRFEPPKSVAQPWTPLASPLSGLKGWLVERCYIWKVEPGVRMDPLHAIARVVCAGEHTPLSILKSERRERPFVTARQICFYLADELTEKSLPAIGRFFNRDHTTVLHGRNAMRHKIAGNPALAEKVASYARAVQGAAYNSNGTSDKSLFGPPE